MDADVVEAITRWVGVSITLVGAFVVSPAGTLALVGRWRRRTVQAARRVEDRLRKIVRRPRTIHLTAHDSVAVSSSATATWSVHGAASGEAPDESVEGRLDRLEKRAAAAEARLAEVTAQAAADRAEYRGELGKLRDKQHADTVNVHARLDHAEEQAVEVDAAALPVVALGVIVSGLSPDAHRLPLAVWVLALALAIAVTARAVWAARGRRQAAQVVGPPQ